MYTTYFLFVLVALGADHAASRWPGPRLSKAPLALVLALIGWRVMELAGSCDGLRRSRAQNAMVAQAYQWLQAQPRRPILLGGSYHSLMFHHFGLTDGHPLTLHGQHQPGVQYLYLVLPQGPSALPAWAAGLPYHVAYQDELVQIHKLDSSPHH